MDGEKKTLVKTMRIRDRPIEDSLVVSYLKFLSYGVQFFSQVLDPYVIQIYCQM